MTSKWRLLDTDFVDPITGVTTVEAVGIARSKDLVPNTIIFWRPNTRFVCLGYFQYVRDEVHADTCEKLDVKIARRILGGGMGYVDQNQLLYDVIMGSEYVVTPVASCIERMYKYVLSGVINGLWELGFSDVVLMPNYNSAIWLNGKKVSGNCATSLTGAQIVGGSLLVDFDFEMLSKVSKNPYKNLKPGITSLEDGLTCINKESKKPFSLEDVKIAVIKGFEKALNIELKQGSLVKEEKELIKELKPKFSSKEWIYHMDIKSKKLVPYTKAGEK